jgi:hypothetical protein
LEGDDGIRDEIEAVDESDDRLMEESNNRAQESEQDLQDLNQQSLE